MRAIFSDRAFASVMAETTEKIKTETGGLFLGKVEDDTWYIIEAIDPGPKSVFQVAYFEYDQQYTQHLINKIANLYDEKLTLIGLWHRHPGSFDIFSSTDDGTNTKYAHMRHEGTISALVNIDPKFRLTVYHVEQPCKYNKIQYEVGDNLIPSNFMRLKTPQRYEQIMQSILTGGFVKNGFEKSVSLKSFMKALEPLLRYRVTDNTVEKPTKPDELIRNKIIDIILPDIMFMADKIGIKMAIVQKDNYIGLVQDAIEGVEKIIFAYSETEDKCFFQYKNRNYTYEEGLFEKSYNKVEEYKNTTF